MRYKLGTVLFIFALALPIAPASADNRPCQGDNACQGRQKKGCAEATAQCSDDDLNGNRVIVCLPQSECRFEGEQPA
jgi:hypothetical protein